MRKSAKLAIMATPGKETLIRAFTGKNDEKEFVKVASEFNGLLEPILSDAWKFYKDKDLTKLE